MELCRRDARVTYFITQSGYEVDFVGEYPDKSMDIIQVSADVSNRVTRNRECRALTVGISLERRKNLGSSFRFQVVR